MVSNNGGRGSTSTGTATTTDDWRVRYWTGSTTTPTTASTGWVSEMEYYGGTSVTSAGHWTMYPHVVIKRVITKPPKHWTKKIIDLYVSLVNDETNTGWKVTALLREIEIVDPMIDVREMRDFLGLLKATASAEDCKRIDAFFTKHGLDGPPKRAARKRTKK